MSTNPNSDEESLLTRPGAGGKSAFQMVSSRGFVEWLAAENLSLALSTYHVGGVILLGRKPTGDVSMHVSAFNHSMGLWTDGQTMWLATAQVLRRLENSAPPGGVLDGFDRVFVPRVGYTTGVLDVHDVAVDADGRPVFVNTLFNCLAAADERCNFRPLWKPPFVSKLVPEDRCHLNGLAMENGRPKYVTLHGKSDVADGWRDHRDRGGLVLDVQTSEVVADGLSMPHSPRLHGGKLWLLNSGTGFVGFLDGSGKFEPVAFIPGYARGLAFHDRYAVIGMSKPRREHAFQGLPLEKNLADRGAAPRCGLYVIETAGGAVVHWVRIESAIEELYDVAVLPGVVRPKAVSFAAPDIGHQFCYVEDGRWQHWSVASAPAGQRASPPNPSPSLS